jgi:xylan 1,4-beta-xylosidase
MDYHTQHAPFGAFASFTLGLPGSRGGFGQSLSGPADQNIYAGFRSASQARWRLLPFFQRPQTAAATAFTGETTSVNPHEPEIIDIATINRHLGWASDTWSCGRFSFRILSPFDHIENPDKLDRAAARLALAPLVHAEIAHDNTLGDTDVDLLFGIGHTEHPLRPLEDTADGLSGFAQGQGFGFAARPSDANHLIQGLDLFNPPARDYRGLHLLSHEGAVVFRVPAGQFRRFPVVLGFYQGGNVTTGLRTRYYYTKLFKNLEDVLGHGLHHHAHYAALAGKRDAELRASRLDENQRWLIAQATHSYLGSSQLMLHKGRPLWIVNEGEYRMINTFDLTVDHLFFELKWWPWAVANTLDLFARRYRYADRIQRPGGTPSARGGVSFTHDMGVMNQFTPPGRSSYECEHLHGCFSHMTMEQLINWICCAATYAEKTGDLDWLRGHQKLLLACSDSLRRRDDPAPAKRTGLPKWDSQRCAADGSEITTYDSLDVSLGQARNNLYIAVKAFAAWTLLERSFTALGLASDAAEARASADLAAVAISNRFEEESGMFPAVFEVGNRSRILPAIEGLVFPLFLGFVDEIQASYPVLFAQLARHLGNALQPGVCIDETSGAWKISSTSPNTWLSKIALAQHVIRKLFPETFNVAARAGDVVHARMQQSVVLGRHAMVDQIHATTGRDLGSRYYPRIVTAILWLEE